MLTNFFFRFLRRQRTIVRLAVEGKPENHPAQAVDGGLGPKERRREGPVHFPHEET